MTPKEIIDEILSPMLFQLPEGVEIVCIVSVADRLNVMSNTNKEMTQEMLGAALITSISTDERELKVAWKLND